MAATAAGTEDGDHGCIIIIIMGEKTATAGDNTLHRESLNKWTEAAEHISSELRVELLEAPTVPAAPRSTSSSIHNRTLVPPFPKFGTENEPAY